MLHYKLSVFIVYQNTTVLWWTDNLFIFSLRLFFILYISHTHTRTHTHTRARTQSYYIMWKLRTNL